MTIDRICRIRKKESLLDEKEEREMFHLQTWDFCLINFLTAKHTSGLDSQGTRKWALRKEMPLTHCWVRQKALSCHSGTRLCS